MANAPERIPVPRSPDDLWTQVVLPYVDEKLRWISSRFPQTVLPPDFCNTYLVIAQKNFREAVDEKRNFHKWADEIKNWKKWAHSLIPYHQINPTYLKSLWEKLCYVRPGATRFSGDAPNTVRKVMAGTPRPNDMSYEEFFDNVLNQTCVNFMRRYFSSFTEPIDSWLYVLTESAAQDVVKNWVPGMRFDKKDRPKGFESINEPPKGDPEGEPFSEKLSAEEAPGAKRAKTVIDTIRGIHSEEGPYGKLSNAVMELHHTHGYTQREIAKPLKLRSGDIKKILDHDWKRWYSIGTENLGLRGSKL